MPIYRSNPEIRPARPEDHAILVRFLNHEADVHRHLDWRTPLEWLGSQPFLLATHERQIQAVLACPPDPPGVAWVRLFASHGHLEPDQYFSMLLEAAQADLAQREPPSRIVAIGLQPWFQRILEANAFDNLQDIVVLEWSGTLPPEQPTLTPIRIRPMTLTDLPVVTAVDQAAFEPVWANSLETLTLAFQQSAWSSVAETDEAIVGYQISTSIPLSGHLARLAVDPNLQHGRIAYALVREMLQHFKQHGAWRVTVNTQDNNLASLALYEKIGFRRTGETFPVYFQPEG
jgi:ribosomal protein S18 acetylase RimI-like enzyme